ncbi:MAG: beta-galactosidase [Clostridium sp.]|nr:beta-galactosidase [Clostridium sp.]MDY5896078.1 glycoside hydrolase family 2 TIM barrel-domain containing protein [Oscillospiraceae bacterium]
MTIPRSEHPDPQFQRKDWLNLNGEWDFEFDFGNSGLRAGVLEKDEWSRKINVPFCPESKLSGIEYTDFIAAVWYRKSVTVTEAQLEGRVLIHFGAVDYETYLYVNGEEAGYHKGGYTSFTFDITEFLTAGENVIAVNARDDVRDPLVPRGKQSELYNSHGCDYTRTTGIWQTVWLEFVPKAYVKSFKLFPDTVNATLGVSAVVEGEGAFKAEAFYDGRLVGSFEKTAAGFVSGDIKLSETHLWEVGCGRLYDLKITFGGDEISSYFGLRDIRIDGYKVLINGKSVFQRLVLDQGFYADGIYTAPSDEALEKDIRLSLAVGFNGARLHQKVFEPRFLYHCDRLGYIVWGEFGNWGLDYSRDGALEAMLPQWCESVARDFNHPAIVGWCPFNETWDRDGRKQNDELLRIVYRVTKQLDETRPCIDTSGNFHVETDIFDVHDYEQKVEIFKGNYDRLMTEGVLFEHFPDRQEYDGKKPAFVSEYGGIQWSLGSRGDAWGYGNAPKSEQEFIDRYKGLTDALLDNERMFGFCYTQLYDIEQEQNGLYYYDRSPKFDPELFRRINSRKAAIED